MKYLLIPLLFLSGCVGLPIEKSFQDELKWNYMEHVWTYADKDSRLRWNYMEKKYEFSK